MVMRVFVCEPASVREGALSLCIAEFVCVFVFEFRIPAAALVRDSETFPRISATK